MINLAIVIALVPKMVKAMESRRKVEKKTETEKHDEIDIGCVRVSGQTTLYYVLSLGEMKTQKKRVYPTKCPFSIFFSVHD